MKKIVYFVAYFSLICCFLPVDGLGQGDSNLASRLFKSAGSTPAKPKVAPPKKSEKPTKKENIAKTSGNSNLKKNEKKAKKADKDPSPNSKSKTTVAKAKETDKSKTKLITPNSKLANKSVAKSATPNPSVKNVTPISTQTRFRTVANKAAAKFKVTIITEKPNIEILIDDEPAGKTNQKSELVKEIEEGTYNLAAKYNEDDIIEKTVTIEKNQTVYLTKDSRGDDADAEESTVSTLKIEETKVPDFGSKPVIETPKPETVAKVVPKEEPKTEVKIPVVVVAPVKQPEKVITMAEKLQSVLEKYYQPQSADSLTEADWQFIRQAILAGETGELNLTDVELLTDLSLGKIDFFNRNFNTALNNYKKAYQTDTKSPFPLLEMGNVYYQNRDYRTAASYFKSALDLNPNLWNTQVKYSRSLLKIGDNNTALQVLDKINRSDFKSDEIITLTAEAYFAVKEYGKVINLLVNESENNPKLENLLILANAFEKSYNPQVAIKHLRLANDISPNNPIVLIKLGELLLLTDKNEGLTLLKKAVELDRNGVYINLSEAQKLIKRAER